MQLVFFAASEPRAQTVALWLLAGFLGSFGFIRSSARLMRSPKVPWWPGSVKSGDLHIHHLVWGIILLLLCGFLGFATPPRTPWTQILAVLFGIGAGFTLDEFALWLRLEDVYWSEKGRASVEAVMIAATFAGFIVIGAVPFPQGSLDAVIPLIIVQLFVTAVLLSKAKYFMALFGLFIPPIAWVSAIRLGRPYSSWGRRRYANNPKKLEKAIRRSERWDRRRRRFENLIGGAPEGEMRADGAAVEAGAPEGELQAGAPAEGGGAPVEGGGAPVGGGGAPAEGGTPVETGGTPAKESGSGDA